jgi:hypothetical protein
MGKQIPTGQPNRVVHITQALLLASVNPNLFTFSEEDDEAHIEFMPAAPQLGLTIVLPGFNAVPPSQAPGSGPRPNDGDSYSFSDPLGLVSNAHRLTVDGGGYNIAGGGVFGPTFTVPVNTIQIIGCHFTFNGSLGVWVACPCLPFAGGF